MLCSEGLYVSYVEASVMIIYLASQVFIVKLCALLTFFFKSSVIVRTTEH
jgi:hypothetical protein